MHPTPSQDIAVERSTRTIAAVALAAVGAALLVISAGTFIAVRWDQLGLPGKAGIVGALALAAIVVGHVLRPRLPGTAGVLTHLGAALVPLDVGGVSVALGSDRPLTGLIAGAAGLASFTLLDPSLVGPSFERTNTPPASRRLQPFMALGRIVSACAVGLGLRAVVGVPPVLFFFVAGVALAFLKRPYEAIGLAALAGAGPVARWAADRSQSGSFFAELGELTAQTPVATLAIAGCAIGVIALAARQLSNRLPALVASLAVLVAASPDALGLVAEHQRTSLILAAASVLAARMFLIVRRSDLAFVIDWTAIATAIVATAIGLEGGALDRGVIVASLLLAASWLVSDLGEHAADKLLQRLWTGASGPISTFGLLTAGLGVAIGIHDPVASAMVMLVVSVGVGLSSRSMATSVSVIATGAATVMAMSNEPVLFLVGLSAAMILQARAMISLGGGFAPQPAALLQWVGVGLAGLIIVSTSIVDPLGPAAAMLGIAVGVALSFLAARFVAVPDLELAPRLLTAIAVLPAAGDAAVSGGLLTAVGLGLFAEGIVRRRQVEEVLGGCALVIGSWIWAGANELLALEWYVAAPAVIFFSVGCRSALGGSPTWNGMPVGLGLLAGSAILERLGGNVQLLIDDETIAGASGGWHPVVAGAVAIGALVLGVERRWRGPTVVGLTALVSTVLIEVGAVVPLVPVWMLLAAGGLTLLAAGIALERADALRGTTTAVRTNQPKTAALHPMEAFRATWAEFL